MDLRKLSGDLREERKSSARTNRYVRTVKALKSEARKGLRLEGKSACRSAG